jgi:GPH family glycoside/pentoside/hexuronide:cation symporter
MKPPKPGTIEVTHSSDRVPFIEKTLLGSGSLAAFFGSVGISILAYPVFNMLLGINAAWVGIALMIPRMCDAFLDPIVGKFSDNFHSPYGRRKPFIVSGAISMGILFALIWYVPTKWAPSWQIGYFIVLQFLYFIANSIYSVPYNALTYEMTPDYNERTRVMAFCAFFHKLGEMAGGWMLPLAATLGIWLVAGAHDLNMSGIRAMGWIVGIGIMALIGILPGLAVKERFKSKSESQTEVRLWEGIRSAMSSSAFLILTAIIVLNTLSGVLAMGIDQYLLVYFMNGGDKAAGLIQKGLLSSGYALVGFAAIPLITWIASRFGKKGSLYFVYSLMVFGGCMKWFIFTPGHPMYHIGKIVIDPILLIDPLLCGPMWVAVKIMLASMMADICDEDELRHGQRREGVFGAVFFWLEKMVFSMAFLSTGMALTFAHFNPDLGGNQTHETFTRMRLFLAAAPAIAAVFALIALKFYPITAVRAASTRRQLEERRGAVTPG